MSHCFWDPSFRPTPIEVVTQNSWDFVNFSEKFISYYILFFEWRRIENCYFFYDCFFFVISLLIILLGFTGKIAIVSGTIGIFLDSIGAPTTHARKFIYFLNDRRFLVDFWISDFRIFWCWSNFDQSLFLISKVGMGLF